MERGKIYDKEKIRKALLEETGRSIMGSGTEFVSISAGTVAWQIFNIVLWIALIYLLYRFIRWMDRWIQKQINKRK